MSIGLTIKADGLSCKHHFSTLLLWQNYLW